MATEEAKPSEPTFRQELTALINRFSRENGSNTPDFILAKFMVSTLEMFDRAVLERDHWYGKTNSPGGDL